MFDTFILFFIALKDKSRTRSSRFLLWTQIFNLGFIVGTFFIPTYNANNINVDTELPYVYLLGFIYVTLFFFPYIITKGVALTLYGRENRTLYGNSLQIGGILMLIHYISVYLWIFLHGVIYMQSPMLSWAIHSWFLYNFWAGFVVISIIGYFFLYKHGLKNKIKWIKNIGIAGIVFTLTMELYELLAMFRILPFFFLS
ncbi:MAG: hypothetical protein ACXABO_18710 [Promethearchaeota archaeon]